MIFNPYTIVNLVINDKRFGVVVDSNVRGSIFSLEVTITLPKDLNIYHLITRTSDAIAIMHFDSLKLQKMKMYI